MNSLVEHKSLGRVLGRLGMRKFISPKEVPLGWRRRWVSGSGFTTRVS